MELVTGAVPDDFSSRYPKAFAWRERYWDAVKAGKAALPETPVIEGAEATKAVTGADYAEEEASFDAEDPVAKSLGLKKGSKVDVYPEDITGGEKNKDVGELLGLNKHETVLQVKAKEGGQEIRVHAPRWNYKLQAAS